ncbi:hypothetical protein CPB83DRAFT_896701 [Crepidotus variabilis]|uniref:NmrA-like domain-containing protein n=1 Tax=Crepidotus variabilis TaxID=179855 RepID=A0A9P6EB50_9AGAR|nr:hypothetical protein CPB83DRAFT_896701 [Crepidotus variabilis]
MTILIIGGTGKTGGPLANILHSSGHTDLLLTSRSGHIPPPFSDKGHWEKDRQGLHDRTRSHEPMPVATHFLELAKKKGVKRFVFLSGSASAKGDVPHGQIHEYIANMKGIEYAVLRPTWFQENFAKNFLESIRVHDQVFSVAKDGRIPFVAAEDIALAAAEALTCTQSWNCDRFIVGPELFSYDDVARLLSRILGRGIIHERITFSQELKIWTRMGFKPDYAAWLVIKEEDVANGSQEKIAYRKQSLFRKRKLEDYFQSNKHLWMV